MKNGQSICFNKELCALGNSLVVQCLGLSAFTAEDTGSNPLRNEDPESWAEQCDQKKKKKKKWGFWLHFYFLATVIRLGV